MRSVIKFLALAYLFSVCGVSAVQRFSLSGSNWFLQEDGKEEKIPAVVPGSVYTDLLHHGLIDDPYYRFNDLKYRWVAYSNWTYTSTFHLNESVSKYEGVRLLVGGMDSISAISINGHAVGTTNNMFRRYIFDVASYLQPGTNGIEVHFDSPVTYAAHQASIYPYVVPPECPDEAQKGECHANFIRKEACSFSWDWGPAFPTMGIWRNLELESFNRVVFRYVTMDTTIDGDNWVLTVGAHMEVLQSAEGITLSVGIKELGLNCSASFLVEAGFDVKQELACQYPRNVIQPWWPNGHGMSKLYEVNVSLLDSNSQVLDHRIITTGFRTVELVQDPIMNASGLSFYFKINGRPIFMKGSNWIPADSFQERITPEYLRHLLSSAAETNINMLRVWGGGIYESEEFYALADEYGIMLWQDFMFACAMYPTHPEFLLTVREEVKHQVRRLKHHPSIVIWAGNNENEGALRNNWYNTDNDSLLYYKDYITLYVETVYDVVHQEDPRGRPFVPSSPSNGLKTVDEGWVAKNPGDTHYGDVHHYEYNSDSWNWKVFPVPRFASEFGFQSWCSFETLENVSIAEDWDENSNFSFHRQHHSNGQAQMRNEFAMHLKPPSSSDQKQKFKDYIYLTQVNQAMAVRTETEMYRRMQSSIDGNGQGLTMGSLYWQLNDIWQGPTWASIEYGGKWKMLHYYAQHFYNSVLVSPIVNQNLLQIYFVNEKPASSLSRKATKKFKSLKFDRFNRISKSSNNFFNNDANGIHMEQDKTLTLSIKMLSWDNEISKEWIHQFTEPEKTSDVVFERNLDDMAQESGCGNVKLCFIYTTVTTDSEVHANWLPLVNFTDVIGLKRANIKVESVGHTSGAIAITMTSDSIAPFVWMDAYGYQGHFSSNGFLFIPDDRIIVYFFPWSKITDLKAFQNSLEVKSLMDIY